MKIKIVIDANKKVYRRFFCPACHESHMVDYGWQYNEDPDRPTFHPSILVHYAGTFGAERCHSFVREGRIEFLLDSTHELAGKTVELPELGSVPINSETRL